MRIGSGIDADRDETRPDADQRAFERLFEADPFRVGSETALTER